ncbi:MAG: hypothetical protein H6712_06960 [Myxococcales bacterium]|nr:hypothetical protein [Myxococcales bacterium]MCB9713573.1 hypothetical protein [Myxococcales bacterium]
MQSRLAHRRELLRYAGITGVTLLLPSTVACVRGGSSTPPADPEPGDPLAPSADPEPDGLPLVRPADWDPISFNRERGRAGAIPPEYMAKIDGPDGVAQHLGKHLPFLPEGPLAPSGTLALMWGDPALGYARHPNAAATADDPIGHWYDWIRIRRAFDGPAEERESHFSAWPRGGEEDDGHYAAQRGTDPADDDGRNTVYLAVLPSDVQPGEWVRIHAHCLTHGEYVDFLRVPA